LRAPAEALGETATKALIEGTLAKPQRRTFDWQLIERESIRAINVNERGR
jgi:DNA-binding LacI/PurR family transcriptional regulator